MKRTVLVSLYTLGILVICYPCQAEPTPIGYDYLGDEKFDPEPKRKPNANVFLSRLGRNWFQQNSGFTLTNEHYTPKNEELGPDLYESGEGLILPNLLSGHNLYAPTKELSFSKSYNEPDSYELNKVVITNGQPQYENKNEPYLSYSLHGFDLYVQASSYNILNEQKKELSLPSPNGQDSYETDIGLILSDGQHYEPDKEIFLPNSLSGEDWTRLNAGMSWSYEPNGQIQYANIEKLSLPKAIGHIWYRPNVDVYLSKTREVNRNWEKPILTKKSNHHVYETMNTQNSRKQEEYNIVKVRVMRRQQGIKLNRVKNIAFTYTLPKGRYRPKQRTYEYSSAYHNGGQNYQQYGGQNFQKLSNGGGKNKIYDRNQKRFKIEHNRQDTYKKHGKNTQKPGKGKGRNKKFDKNQKRFKIVHHRLDVQYQNQPAVYKQYVNNYQNDNLQNFHNNHNGFGNKNYNYQNNYKTFSNNYNTFQNNHNRHGIVHGQSIGPNQEANKPKVFWEEPGDGPLPEILVGRPDNYWPNHNKLKHYFK